MKSTLLLMQLQRVDNEINRLLNLNQKIHLDIDDNSSINEVGDKLQQLKNKMKDVQELSLELDAKIKALRNKVEQFTASLFGGNVHNSKELLSLQTEILNIKSLISNYEEEQLIKWEELESCQSVVNSTESQLQSLLDSKKVAIEKSTQELTNNQREIDRHNIEKRGIREQISRDLLEIYDRLFITKKGFVISMIEDECCMGCGTTLTPSERQQAKSHSSIIYCPTCGRILYAD